TDWKQINDPAFKLYAFQGQSEGEFANYILTPNYQIVQISGTETILSSRDCNINSNNQGVLYSFKLGNETYCWNESKSGDNKYYYGEKQLQNFNKVNSVSNNATVSLYFDLQKPCPEPSYRIDVKYSEISNIFTADGINNFIANNRTNEQVITVNCNTNQDSYESLNTFGKNV
ncbi:hypothetical protein, partial [Paenimyroides tangerinum]|uniref:hypothetical protein n=1 Tax=Paenimyroides tangerinum TaxID=2488728 RepID=UPI00131541E5